MPDSAPSFVSHLLARLDDLRARVEGLPPPSHDALVILLPGLPGSELARGEEELWVNLAATRKGGLFELAYDPGAPPLDAPRAFELIYGQLQLRLQLRGHHVVAHPFDWRRPLAELGADLAAHIAGQGQRVVHLVGHSMGGLVARAATLHLDGLPNLGKVIMLGTPNHGTYTVVQGIRGRHWVLRVLGAIDEKHTVDELATGVFATWPAVYAQLPGGGEVDLFDPASWPDTGPRPQPDLLESAPAVQEWLAASRGDFHVIAGYGFSTVVGVRRGFEYLESDGGDGWVPTGLAKLDGHPCYFAKTEHILMPNDEHVIAAVEALLEGRAPDLPSAPPPPRELAPSSDATVLPAPFGGRVGHDITDADVGAFLADVLHPT